MASSNSTLTQERLKELLHYDPGTGLFTWLVCKTNATKVGDVAGSVEKKGYVVISIVNQRYKAHRLAWLYMTGKWPLDQIDHINGVKNDNRFVNFREASNIFNTQNQRRPRVNNSLGILGVNYRDDQKRYCATICVNAKKIHLGSYKTPEEASAAYIEAKRKYHESCTI